MADDKGLVVFDVAGAGKYKELGIGDGLDVVSGKLVATAPGAGEIAVEVSDATENILTGDGTTGDPLEVILPVATISDPGIVKPDGTTITIASGVISGAAANSTDATISALAIAGTKDAGSVASFARADHEHAGPGFGNVAALNDTASNGTETTVARSDHVHQIPSVTGQITPIVDGAIADHNAAADDGEEHNPHGISEWMQNSEFLGAEDADDARDKIGAASAADLSTLASGAVMKASFTGVSAVPPIVTGVTDGTAAPAQATSLSLSIANANGEGTSLAPSTVPIPVAGSGRAGIITAADAAILSGIDSRVTNLEQGRANLIGVWPTRAALNTSIAAMSGDDITLPDNTTVVTVKPRDTVVISADESTEGGGNQSMNEFAYDEGNSIWEAIWQYNMGAATPEATNSSTGTVTGDASTQGGVSIVSGNKMAVNGWSTGTNVTGTNSGIVGDVTNLKGRLDNFVAADITDASAIGEAILKAADAAGVRAELALGTIVNALVTANTNTGDAQTALGAGATGKAVFVATTPSAARAALELDDMFSVEGAISSAVSSTDDILVNWAGANPELVEVHVATCDDEKPANGFIKAGTYSSGAPVTVYLFGFCAMDGLSDVQNGKTVFLGENGVGVEFADYVQITDPEFRQSVGVKVYNGTDHGFSFSRGEPIFMA